MSKLKKAGFFTTEEFISLTRDDYAFEEAAALIQLRAESFIKENELLEDMEDSTNIVAEVLNNYSSYDSEFKETEPKLMSVFDLIVALSTYREAKFKQDNIRIENAVYLVLRKALNACEYTNSERGGLHNKDHQRELVRNAAREKLKTKPGANISDISQWIRNDILNNRAAFGFNDKEKIPSVKTLQNSWINDLKSQAIPKA
jgi:hypothetical protein